MKCFRCSEEIGDAAQHLCRDIVARDEALWRAWKDLEASFPWLRAYACLPWWKRTLCYGLARLGLGRSVRAILKVTG